MNIPRKQTQTIIQDLKKKIVFVVGPRQVGKTWIAKEVMKSFEHPLYLNFDDSDHRKIIKDKKFLFGVDLVVFDEIHKMRNWKNYLKGIYDTKPEGLSILVTGSARLNAYRRVGDSLAGRYLLHRILPFSLQELKGTMYEGAVERLLTRGGFPERFLTEDTMDERLRSLYIESMINVDVLDFAAVEDIRSLHTILRLLRERVGSSLSYASIAEDVGISPKTAKRYIDILEDLYIIFRVTPYTTKIARAIRKEPKVYFFDTGMVQGGEDVRLENLVALSLLKDDFYREDVFGEQRRLAYVRVKDGPEVDFVRVHNEKAQELIEVKLSQGSGTRQLSYYSQKYHITATQVVGHTTHTEVQHNNIHIVRAKDFLEGLSA
ncbi:ATP-binding protein [Candidatus Kaiserbacteria bacterium]|nr:MAG: ATP-binding protein [Candidatus Kaiserbacteria bacterium]